MLEGRGRCQVTGGKRFAGWCGLVFRLSGSHGLSGWRSVADLYCCIPDIESSAYAIRRSNIFYVTQDLNKPNSFTMAHRAASYFTPRFYPLRSCHLRRKYSLTGHAVSPRSGLTVSFKKASIFYHKDLLEGWHY